MKGRDPKQNPTIEEARKALLSGMGVPSPTPFVPDAFQIEAVTSVAEGHDTLVVAPTGAGKTYIALESIRAALLQKKRAIYTTPLKALSNTKYADLKRRFEPEFSVGLLTGDRKIDCDSNVVIATTEIYRNELYRSPERYSVVVLDEVHFIADAQRGPVWEESIILTPSSSTLVMLSASISNASEIAAWIEDVRGKPCRIVTKKERPVELRYGFLHPELGIIPLSDSRGGVFKEVAAYYGASGLDPSGMRLRGGSFSRRDGDRGRSRRGGRGRGRR
jgi:ATP-dependent RNA helicase HelY